MSWGTFSAVTAAMMLLASQAMADDFYIQAQIGKRYLSEGDLTLDGTKSEVEFSVFDGLPLSGSGAIGYRFRSFPYDVVDTRIEIQGGVTESEPHSIKPRGTLATLQGTTAEIGANADNLMSIFGMVNLWIDYRLGDSWLVSAGGGLGVAQIIYDRFSARTIFLDDSDLVFAYQGGLGVGYEIIPDLVASLDYRYFATSGPQLSFNGDWEAEYAGHDLMFTFRYYFR